MVRGIRSRLRVAVDGISVILEVVRDGPVLSHPGRPVGPSGLDGPGAGAQDSAGSTWAPTRSTAAVPASVAARSATPRSVPADRAAASAPQ